MKRAIFVVLGAAAVAAAATASPVRAQDNPPPAAEQQPPAHRGKHGDKQMRERMIQMMKEKLELNADQVKKLEAVHKAHEAPMRAAHERLAKAMKKLHGEVEIEAPESEIKSALDAAESAETGMRSEHEKMKAEVDAILTPTQRAKMLLLHSAGMKRSMMMGHMMMGGDHPAWARMRQEGGEGGPDMSGPEGEGAPGGHDVPVEDDAE